MLAVDFFGEFGQEPCMGDTTGIEDDANCWLGVNNQTIALTTPRGLTYGEEYYSTFSRALFTLFQVLTGESWAEVVARPLVFVNGGLAYVSVLYHVSFIILCGIVLVNVVVAVLLEKMVDPESSVDPDAPDIASAPVSCSSATDAAICAPSHSSATTMPLSAVSVNPPCNNSTASESRVTDSMVADIAQLKVDMATIKALLQGLADRTVTIADANNAPMQRSAQPSIAEPSIAERTAAESEASIAVSNKALNA